MEAYILCAGKQIRQGGKTSKMMADINGTPAISHTLSAITSIIPEDLVTVITSNIFPDLNLFVSDRFPKARILIDNTPGEGTARTLAKSLPWKTERIFVTEGDIYYLPHLIVDGVEKAFSNPDVKAVLSITPHTSAAPTHRGVEVKPSLNIHERGGKTKSPTYRNLGAHTLKSDIIDYVDLNVAIDVIDVIRRLHTNGLSVIANVYLSTFLHLAEPGDAAKWNEYFASQNI